MNRATPAAFISYVRFEDEHNNGRLSDFCRLLSAEIRVQTGEEFYIFQDRKDIGWGENWEHRIDESIDAVTFLIPIITPSYFKSEACRNELARFLEREKKQGRNDLILPIYYVNTPLLNDPEKLATDELAQVIASHQYADWRHLRFEPFSSSQVGKALEQLAIQIRQALERIPTTETSQQRVAQAADSAEIEEEVGLLEATQTSQEMLKLVSKLAVELNYIIARVSTKLKRFDNLTKKPTEEKTKRAEQLAFEVASELDSGAERINEHLPKLERGIDIFIRFLSDLLSSVESEEDDGESINYEQTLAGLHDKIKSSLVRLRSHRKSILDMAQRSGRIKPAARRLAQAVDGIISPLERFGSFCEQSIRNLNQR
jgi:hypothetical protein